MADEKEKLTKEEKEIVELTRQQKENMAESADLASKMVDIFKKLNVEMGKNQNVSKLSNSFNKQILSDTKTRATIESQMASDIGKSQQKIIASKLKSISIQAKLEQEIIDLKKEQESANEMILSGESSGEEIYKKTARAIEIKEGRLIKVKNISDSIIKKVEAELKARQDLLKNSRLQSGYMANMEDASYAVLGPFGDIVMKAKQFNENIKVIPLRFMLFNTLIKAGVDRFIALDKAAEDFRKQTGFSNTQMVELRKNAESINVEFQDMGVGINEVYTSAKALTDVFGRTSLVSREAMQNVSLMSVNLGVAAEDSANVLATFQGLGEVTQEAAMNVMKVGAGFSEKAGIPFSLVMKDIANASEQTTALLGANPSKLMKSAIAARALGTDLNKIVSSQRKLLDFSSSINDELEASALLGRSISFQKARQLAYDGDIEGAAKATLASVKAAGNFNEMNVYQREALAKASGMELKDLTKMMAVEAQRSEIELRGTDEQKAKLKMQTEALEKLKQENDLSKEGLLAEGERAIRQQKMQGQMTKLKNIMESLMVSLGDILEPIITGLSDVVVPLFKVLAGILKVTIIPLMKLMAEPLKLVGELLGGASESLNKFGNYMSKTSDETKKFFAFFDSGWGRAMKVVAGLGAGLLTLAFFGKGGFSAVTKGISSSFGMLKGGLSKIPGLGGLGGGAGAVGKVGDIAKSAKGSGFGESLGKGIASFMKYVSDGIGHFGDKKISKGALGIALVGFSIIPFVIAMKMFSGVDWKSVGIGSLALLGFTAAAFGLGALLSTGVGAAIFGAGVIGIAALGAALIPFAAAALMAGVGINRFNKNGTWNWSSWCCTCCVRSRFCRCQSWFFCWWIACWRPN
jgi:hypothetical protein